MISITPERENECWRVLFLNILVEISTVTVKIFAVCPAPGIAPVLIGNQ